MQIWAFHGGWASRDGLSVLVDLGRTCWWSTFMVGFLAALMVVDALSSDFSSRGWASRGGLSVVVNPGAGGGRPLSYLVVVIHGY